MGLFIGNRGAEKSRLIKPPAKELNKVLAEPVRVDLPERPADEKAAPAISAERQSYLQQMRLRLHQQLVERLDVQNLRSAPINIVRHEVRALIRELCATEKGLLSSVVHE
jgi:hypothetical protein